MLRHMQGSNDLVPLAQPSLYVVMVYCTMMYGGRAWKVNDCIIYYAEEWIEWCGFLVNTSTLDVKIDVSRYASTGDLTDCRITLMIPLIERDDIIYCTVSHCMQR